MDGEFSSWQDLIDYGPSFFSNSFLYTESAGPDFGNEKRLVKSRKCPLAKERKQPELQSILDLPLHFNATVTPQKRYRERESKAKDFSWRPLRQNPREEYGIEFQTWDLLNPGYRSFFFFERHCSLLPALRSRLVPSISHAFWGLERMIAVWCSTFCFDVDPYRLDHYGNNVHVTCQNADGRVPPLKKMS